MYSISSIKNYFTLTFKNKKLSCIMTSLAFFALLIIADELNLLSRLYFRYIAIFSLNIQIILLIITFSIIVILLVKHQIIKALSVTSIVLIDYYLFVLCFVLVEYSILLKFIGYQGCKIYTVIVLIILLALVILARIIAFCVTRMQPEEYKSTFYDICDIYKNNFPKADNTNVPILVEERDVHYDLLNHGHIIDSLFSAITYSKPDLSYVIGLEGEWGSGKTTIINIVKDRIKEKNSEHYEYVIVDKFSPWLYENQEAFLLGMFDSILDASGINYSFLQSRKSIAKVSEFLSSNSTSSIIKTLFCSQYGLSNRINDIKAEINRYLESNNKVIVFFIDDLDRSEPENIVFLFKALSLILDFKRTIYILSYDPEQISKIFEYELKIDKRYIEKIINMIVKLDTPNTNNLKSIYSTCLRNILSAYENKPEKMANYDLLINCISSNINNMRNFKRLINSILYTPMVNETHLYKPDLLGLEYIKYCNRKLYQKIYEHKIFFVSHDSINDQEIYSAQFASEKFQKDASTFFSDLNNKSENKSYINLLSDMFPNTSKDFTVNSQFNRVQPKRDTEEVAENVRICSARYFDLYFSYLTNDFIDIKNNVINYIYKINNDAIFPDINISDMNSDKQKLYFEYFHLFIEKISPPKRLSTAITFFEYVYYVDDSSRFLYFSARRRVILIISNLLSKLSLTEMEDFILKASQAYSKIMIIYQILRNMENDNGTHLTRIKEFYKNMCDTIVSKEIDLYLNENYHFHNITGLLAHYEKSSKIIKDYMLNIISTRNIYRVLGDTISLRIGNDYNYYISKDAYNLLLNGTDIDRFIRERSPKTDSEKFVLSVYQSSNQEGNGVPCTQSKPISLSEGFHFNL